MACQASGSNGESAPINKHLAEAAKETQDNFCPTIHQKRAPHIRYHPQLLIWQHQTVSAELQTAASAALQA